MKKVALLVLIMAAVCVEAQQSAESNIISISAQKVLYFSDYAKSIVEPAINEWSKKDEFEKMADYQKRVNDVTRDIKVKQLTEQCQKDYINKYAPKVKLNPTIAQQYDSENEVFLISDAQFGQMLVPVPISEGRTFKSNWSTAKFTPKYTIDNDVLAIAELDIFIPALNKHYKYSNQNNLNYELARVDYNFKPIEIDAVNTNNNRGNQTIGEKKFTAGASLVDTQIPETSIRNENTFVVIIANEDYQMEQPVPFAKNDGRTFAKYCQRTLGIPAQQIHIRENATYNHIKYELSWLKNVCDKYEGAASVIFYYAGHGVPDEKDRSAYLLPVDGMGKDVASGYKLDDLYSKLGTMPAKSVEVFLDACFSGADRQGKMLASNEGGRSVVIAHKSGVPQGKMVVFSATQGDEVAHPDNEQGHGMFTYYLLKKLQETKGDATLGQLSEYVQKEVSKRSAVIGKPQNPKITSASEVDGEWMNWKVR